MKKKIVFLISLAVFILLFAGLQRLLTPKYVTANREGALTREYYDNASENDILFIGDCEVFESFNPMLLWENYGITSYIRGNANQTIWQSYYLLEESLKYETPDIVVFNVLSMKYSEPVREEYNRLVFDDMKAGVVKLEAVRASMNDNESLADYIFPLFRYHYRYKELTKEDFKYYFNTPKVSFMGYLYNDKIVPYTALPAKTELADYSFDDKCYDYLDGITALCRKNNIKLILVKAPSLYPYWYDEWDEAMSEYAKKNDLLYINFLDASYETGIDYSTDTYDGGLHLNVNGANKLTECFAQMLSSKLAYTPCEKSSKTVARWQKRLDEYKKVRK